MSIIFCWTLMLGFFDGTTWVGGPWYSAWCHVALVYLGCENMQNMLKRIVFTVYHLPKTMESIEDHLLKLRLNRRYVKPSTNTLGQFVIVCYGKWLVYSWFTYKTGNFPIFESPVIYNFPFLNGLFIVDGLLSIFSSPFCIRILPSSAFQMRSPK